MAEDRDRSRSPPRQRSSLWHESRPDAIVTRMPNHIDLTEAVTIAAWTVVSHVTMSIAFIIKRLRCLRVRVMRSLMTIYGSRVCTVSLALNCWKVVFSEAMRRILSYTEHPGQATREEAEKNADALDRIG